MKKERTIIIGTIESCKKILKEMSKDFNLKYHLVGLVIDEEDTSSFLSDINLYGPFNNISYLIKKLNIERVIVSSVNATPKRLSVIIKELIKSEINHDKVSVYKSFSNEHIKEDQDIIVEKLLNRKPLSLDNSNLNKLIKNKTILVTGGGGFIGSELCKEIVKYEPKTLIIFDIYENTTYELQMELERMFYKNKKIKKPNIEILIGSVYNEYRVKNILEKYKPEIIFHAAAYKHVPLMETNAVEAIRTNVLGTYNVATLADLYGVKKMILISTDKAVRPTNIMGATKRSAENIIQYQNSIAKKTSYSAVRFGNVLGSTGSVIPLFKRQIFDGGPITITHKEVSRYFMTISEAVNLILLSATLLKGGEIFVLNMEEQIKILDIALEMIKYYGYKPYEEIDVVFTKLRPGEKLHEEMLINPNSNVYTQTKHSMIFIEKESFSTFEQLKIAEIKEKIDSLSNEEAKKLIKKVIDTYKN